ncbi:MAG: efflux RND transporter periplasmic adaptor subunit [Bacteroidota bacterium]
MRSFVAFPAGILMLAVVLAGCSRSNGAENTAVASDDISRAVRVETLVLEPRLFEEVIEVTGSVEALEDAMLSAQASGTVMSLVNLGTFVRQGELVAQLDPRIAQAAVRQSQAQVEAARVSYELAADNFRRNEPLFADSIISALEFENVRAQHSQARASLAQAEAGLAQAQEQLRNTRVTAPFTGTVEERFVQVGEQISPGQAVVRVVSTDRVRVRAGVPERFAGDISRGTPVAVSLNAYGGASGIPAAVTFVGGAVDPQSRTFPIEVEIPNPEGRIKPEMVATLFVTRRQIEDAIVAPRPALMREEQGFVAYVVDRSSSAPSAEMRNVETGPSYANEVVIRSGLVRGEEIIVLGQNNVAAGDPLNIVEIHRKAPAEATETSDEHPPA